VSTDPTPLSDMSADLAELNVARLQFARFAGRCRLFAPLYRQVTLSAVRRWAAGGGPLNILGIGYDDVRNAWNFYLEHENKGRGFVLIGHSQGSVILTELIRNEIDGKDVQSRLVSTLLIGLPGFAVPRDRDVGGTFQHVPLCRRASQTGCVVTYSSFRSTAPPPADTLFGRVNDPTMRGACTNPAALEGGEGELHSYFDTTGTQHCQTRILETMGSPGHTYLDAHGEHARVILRSVRLQCTRNVSRGNGSWKPERPAG
jgi:hypothetical protein